MANQSSELLDTLIDAFECEWRTCGRPDVAAFLDRVAEAERPALRRELVRLELEYRLCAGEPVRVEECLGRFPEVQAEAMGLIALEYRVRLDRAERVGVAEYIERFPALRDALPEVLGPLRRVPDVPGYEALEEIGRGGMGVVYKAIDQEIGRTAALKVVRTDGTPRPEVEARFLDEVRITGRLQHPGVPPVHRVGRLADGGSFLAMKLVEGTTLAARLAARTDPGDDLPDLLRVFEQVCQTVAYAHRQGVIHRDLKPANVMVGAFGEVQVMDWGLAKWASDPTPPRPDGESAGPASETQTGTVLGTPAYMPPEQARGERVDERADVFALGAILGEILTGLPPYAGSDALSAARGGDLSRARQRLGGCSDRELSELAERCLAPDAAERPRDAAAVAAALAAHREGAERRLREAERQGAVERARLAEERKRRRALLVAGVVSLLILTAGVVGTGIGLWRAVQAERANQARLAASHVDAGRLGLQQGRWREALASFDNAVRAGHPETAELLFHRLRARNALADYAAVTQEVEALARRDDLDEEQVGLLHLWKGDIILTRRGRSAEAVRHVREALRHRLPPAEAAYAAGLLAETTPEALRHFRAALDADPLHYQAHYHHLLLQVLLGRHMDARASARLAETLFADDPNFAVFRALFFALAGDLPAALRTFERVKDGWGDDRRAARFRVILEVFHFGSRIEELHSADDSKKLAAAGRIVSRINEAFAGLGPDAAAGGDAFPLVAPPVLSRTFGPLPLLSPGVPSLPFFAPNKPDLKAVEQLAEAARGHPEGVTLYLHGMAARRAERWAEAEASYAAAADGPGLFPVRRMALLEAIEVGWRLADVHGKRPDVEAKRRLVERLRQAVRSLRFGDDPGITAADYEGLASKAWQSGERNVAHIFLDHWTAREPKNSRCLRLRAAVHYSSAAYASAIEAARAAQKAGHLDPDVEADLNTILTLSPQFLARQAEMYAHKPKDKGKGEKPKDK